MIVIDAVVVIHVAAVIIKYSLRFTMNAYISLRSFVTGGSFFMSYFEGVFYVLSYVA